ncbi:DUF2946 domain-containing protein [Pseudoduganella lurida]|nr:DUF2946 domain-containing protein [Pseudoduganella lurida]
MKTPAKRLLTVWLACCAILLNALVPAVSHAFAAASGPQHTWEICLNDGTTLSGTGELDHALFLQLTDRSRPLPGGVAIGGHDQAGAHASDHADKLMADCAYCLPHAGSVGLPPSAPLVLPSLTAGTVKPYLFYHAPRPLQAWTAAQPRGPPRDA